MLYGFFHPFHLSKKNNWEKDLTLNLWVERRILTNTSHVFSSLKLLHKEDTYNINHCVDTIKKIHFFLHVGHCIVDASNLVSHLTCYACLMFALIRYMESHGIRNYISMLQQIGIIVLLK
jgi:hypothetical protein